MNTRIDHHSKQLTALYDGKNWLGANFTGKLNDLTAEQAFSRPVQGSKNIIELLYHILAWRGILVSRLEGDFEAQIEMNSEKDWKTFSGLDKHAWEEMLKRLDRNQTRLLDILKDKDDSFLDKANNAKGLDLGVLLESMMQHDIYHLGQIALIKSQLAKMKEGNK